MKSTLLRNWWQSGSSGAATADTTEDGEQAYLIIGDSNGGDTTSTTTYGPATSAGIALKWNGTNTTDVANTDFSNRAGVFGTPWKQFALNRNNSSGKKVVICNRAVGGSNIYPDGVDTNNWFPINAGTPLAGGSLYEPAVIDANNCLSFLGLTKFKAIIIWLCVNDLNAGTSFANINTGQQSLITRVVADFPDTKIYLVSHSITGTLGMTTLKFQMKKMFRDLAQNNANIELLCNLDSFARWGYDDGIHLTQPGYNKIGELLARSENSEETNKEVRQVYNYFDTELSTAHKAAWKTFIEGRQSAGNWIYDAIDSLQIYGSSTRSNVFMDITNIQVPLDGSFDHVANTFIHTDVGKTIFDNYVPSVCAVNTTVTDFAKGTKVGTNLTPAGTQGILYSPASGTLRRLFQTSGSVINYNVNDSTNTSYTGETKLGDNAWYTILRNGTTKALYKNGTQVHSAVVAAGAISTASSEIGGGSSEINEQVAAHYTVKQSVVNIAAFEAAIDTLLTALAS